MNRPILPNRPGLAHRRNQRSAERRPLNPPGAHMWHAACHFSRVASLLLQAQPSLLAPRFWLNWRNFAGFDDYSGNSD
jgi:hypothetical protein